MCLIRDSHRESTTCKLVCEMNRGIHSKSGSSFMVLAVNAGISIWNKECSAFPMPMRNRCYGHSLLPLNTNSEIYFYLQTEPNVTVIYFCRLRQTPDIFTVIQSWMLQSSISAVKDKLLTFIFTVIQSRMSAHRIGIGRYGGKNIGHRIGSEIPFISVKP